MKLLTATSILAIALTASTGALAYDLDHPFFGPAKGQFVSDTAYSFERSHSKDKEADEKMTEWGQTVSEKVSFGITDNWTVSVSGDRNWAKGKYVGDYAAHEKGAEWDIGTTYNIVNDGRAFVQLGGFYGQVTDPVTKALRVTGMAGYNFDFITPYMQIGWTRPVNWGHDNHNMFDAFVGVYKKFVPQFSASAGFNFEKYDYQNRLKNVGLEGTLNYLVTKNVNLRLNAATLLKEKTKYFADETRGSFELGASVQVAF